MNFYNPYFSYIPYQANATSTSRGILSTIFKNRINWGSILTNTQKTLSVINQGIPIIKQISPVVKNAKTMFKVLNEFKKVDVSTNEINSNTFSEKFIKEENIQNNNVNHTNDSGPIFYV